MSNRVKSKLQRLIRDLESGGDGGDAAEAAAGAATAEQRRRGAGGGDAGARGEDDEPAAVAALEGEASSVSLGLSDITKTDTSGSDTTPGTHFQVPQSSSSRRAGSSGLKRHVAELEAKVLGLLLERKAAEARHARELALRDAEAARLQAHINDELEELQARQAQVEESAPSVRQQLQQARAALGDMAISHEAYLQLKKLPADRLQLPDAVRVAVHESLQGLQQDNERLRVAAASAREAAARQEAEIGRLQRENSRLAAAVADKEADVEATISALESRVARLSAELQEAAVAAEVGAAKAAVYDELQARADRLESELSRLSGAEAAAERLRAQLAAAEGATAGKEATAGLLMADKAYLGKEVQIAQERLAEAGARLAAAEDKVAQLKAERQELYAKLAAASDATHSQFEGRWEREVARLQAASAADLERIRKEAAETAEREARMLRDLRDAALDEAARAKSELRQLRQEHEDLLLSSRDAAARSDVASSELLGELKLKAFELARLQALCDERGEAVERLGLQAELLSEKNQLLAAELAQLERDDRGLVAELQQRLDAAESRLREYQAADALLDRAVAGAAAAGDGAVADLQQQMAALLQPAGGGPLGRQQQQLSGALQRRLRLNVQLAARCARLEADKQQMARENSELSAKLLKAQAAVEKLHGQLRMVGQPQGYLLAQLQAAEAAASSAREQLEQVQEALEAKGRAAAEAAAERAALKADLQRILRERGAIESVRRLVASAVAAAQGQPAAGGQAGVPAAAGAGAGGGG